MYFSAWKNSMPNAPMRLVGSLSLFSLVTVQTAFAQLFHSSNSPPPGVILISASINGQPATLLLDTGAEHSCLDVRYAAQLRLSPTGMESIRQPYATTISGKIRIGNLRIESLDIQNIDLLSADLTSMLLAVGNTLMGFWVTMFFATSS
jgi:hypothetical protein